MRLALALVSLALATSASAQTTWYVDDDGLAPGDGTLNHPYTSIDYAVAQATTVSGDTLSVAPGTYFEALDLRGKGLLIAGDPTDKPVIDASGRDLPVVRMISGEPPGTELRSLVLRGGTGMAGQCTQFVCVGGPGVFVAGSSAIIDDCEIVGDNCEVGGSLYAEFADVVIRDSELGNGAITGGCIYLYSSSATLEGCDFPCAWALYGGVLYAETSSVDVRECTFSGCGFYDQSYGGAMIVAGGDARIEDCFFTGLITNESGGAILARDATLTLDRCSFANNECIQGLGAAVRLRGGTCAIRSSTFSSNRSTEGGAISTSESFPAYVSIEDCTFESNTSLGGCCEAGRGGAIFCSDTTMMSVERSLFVGNRAFVDPNWGQPVAGGALRGPAVVDSCTFVGNSAEPADQLEGGTLGAGASVRNSILRDSTPDVLSTDCDAVYSNVSGGWPGEGNIDEDPLFVDAAAGDFALAHASPCIDAGDPDDPLDPDDTRADMGAFPYTWAEIGQKYCSTNPNSSGQPASVFGRGSASVADNWLKLWTYDAAPNQFGYYLVSATQDFVPNFGGSDGNLCLGGKILRFGKPADVLFSGSEGVMVFQPDLTDLPQDTTFLPGETWSFQLWFRDVVGAHFTSNTSDGLAITWR